MKINEHSGLVYPSYMDTVYEGMYDNDALCHKLDGFWSCRCRTFFQYGRLVNALTEELVKGQNICQFGITFGNQIDETALAIGKTGIYDIVDINRKSLNRMVYKYGNLYPQLRFTLGDAAFVRPAATRDAVICFMLLSMLPEKHKKAIISNALKMLKPKGKAIFIDWHKPNFLNPFGFWLKMYNRLYHPFTEQLWDTNIKFLCEDNSAEFSWHKTLFFGGMFQKTVVTRIPDDKDKNLNP